MNCSTPGFPTLHCLLEFAQTYVQWVQVAIQPACLFRPLLLLPSIVPSIRVFSSETALQIRCPEYWSFTFSISLSNEYSGLTSLGLTGWISLQSKGLSRVFLSTTVKKHQFFVNVQYFLSTCTLERWQASKKDWAMVLFVFLRAASKAVLAGWVSGAGQWRKSKQVEKPLGKSFLHQDVSRPKSLPGGDSGEKTQSRKKERDRLMLRKDKAFLEKEKLDSLLSFFLIQPLVFKN